VVRKLPRLTCLQLLQASRSIFLGGFLSSFIKVVDSDVLSLRLQHGSRSSSSACGSADVLATLGVAVDLGPEVNLLCMLMSLYQ
jgi:hypothetical protein